MNHQDKKNIEINSLSKISEFDLINQQIISLLYLISKEVNHPITLLVYSHDVDNFEKLNFFELSFDHYKYFSNYHSIILDHQFDNISTCLILEIRKQKNKNNLNKFMELDIPDILPSIYKCNLSNLIHLLYIQCIKLKYIEQLTAVNYLQYTNNQVKVFTLNNIN